MNPYYLPNCGSTWSKWDMHLHTPNTMLNDCYKTVNGSDVWKKYIKVIEESDVEVFGITDYFSIDNYAHFIELYKREYPKTKKIFFPNIEFRLDVSVNIDAEEVNIHVVFDNKLSVEEIRMFLLRLPSNIPSNNAKISCGQLSKQQINGAAINYDDLNNCLTETFGNKLCYIICVAGNNQGLRPNTKSLRKINVSENIERFCQIILAGHQCRNYYLQNNRYSNGEVSKPKPVISCSDSHSFLDIKEKLGKENFFTWIKATPTFNGLRQIMFEPEDRVAIQVTEPDYKEPHNIIRSVEIKDDSSIFGNRKFLFNKNLNTIIGGKSSGKSLLLFYLAKSVDPQQISNIKEKFDKFVEYSLSGPIFNIEWADGVIDTNNNDIWEMEDDTKSHKITYIPQLYINYLAEKKGKDELNQLIDEILLQNEDFKNYKINFENNLNEINNQLNNSLESLFTLRNDWFSINEEVKNYTTQEIYNKQIDELTYRYSKINTTTILSEIELVEYKSLISEKTSCEAKLSKLSNNKIYLSHIKNELIQNYYNLIGNTSQNKVGSLNKYFAKINTEVTDTKRIVAIITEGYNLILTNFDKEYSTAEKETEILSLNTKIAELDKKISPFKERLAKKSELPELLQDIEKAKSNKTYAMELDERRKAFLNDYKLMKNNIADSLKKRSELYSSFGTYINENFNNMGLGIELQCNIYYPLTSFGLYDLINKNFSYNSKYLNNLFDENNETINYAELPILFSNLFRVEGTTLLFSDKSTHQLRKAVDLDLIFRSIVQDNFLINYNVTYNGDNLLKMSPGKKGTVLLILFLELNTSKNPILIDQPEDNLDNRTVFDLLGKMIKNKKKTRQIIIVTHNANLVVNTDAENVIVANQEGQDQTNVEKARNTKFEYINGPIELSFRNKLPESILSEMGIKQHICDILEGGDEAFKLREQKYKDKL